MDYNPMVNSSEQLPLWIDCDPGIDDAVALLWALGSPSLRVLGISTVAGNVPVSLTSANGLGIVALAGVSGVPVYAGCPGPLVRSPIYAAEIHGENGLGGLVLEPNRGSVEPKHGVTALMEAIEAGNGTVTIATLGPLTNLAVALIQAPDLARKIKQLVIMGGAKGEGNVTPTAEFNLYADPHAAQVVLDRVRSFHIPTTIIPLNVTHQMIVTPTRQQDLQSIGNRVSAAVYQMLKSYDQTPEALARGFGGPPLHDPCVIAYSLDPSLFTTTPAIVTIETQSPLTLGCTVVEPSADPQSSVRWATGVQDDRLWQQLCQTLRRYPH